MHEKAFRLTTRARKVGQQSGRPIDDAFPRSIFILSARTLASADRDKAVQPITSEIDLERIHPNLVVLSRFSVLFLIPHSRALICRLIGSGRYP